VGRDLDDDADMGGVGAAAAAVVVVVVVGSDVPPPREFCSCETIFGTGLDRTSDSKLLFVSRKYCRRLSLADLIPDEVVVEEGAVLLLMEEEEAAEVVAVVE